MSGFVAKDNGSDFEHPPEGLTRGTCIKIIDMGTTENEMYNNTQHQVMFTWEMPDELMEDGQPFIISKFYTVSLHEKAHLRKDIESWFSKTLPDEVVKNGLPLDKFLSRHCMLNVIKQEKNNRTKSIVSAITPLPKAMERPQIHNEPCIFYFFEDENGNTEMYHPEVFQNLSDKMKAKIMKSEEYIAFTSDESQQNDQQMPADLDDDIPF